MNTAMDASQFTPRNRSFNISLAALAAFAIAVLLPVGAAVCAWT
jgi:hypothetical protein